MKLDKENGKAAILKKKGKEKGQKKGNEEEKKEKIDIIRERFVIVYWIRFSRDERADHIIARSSSKRKMR